MIDYTTPHTCSVCDDPALYVLRWQDRRADCEVAAWFCEKHLEERLEARRASVKNTALNMQRSTGPAGSFSTDEHDVAASCKITQEPSGE